MICIDFKKAFDTVSRDFLSIHCVPLVLDHHLCNGIHTFYNNISNCVLDNGFSTQPFAIERGVRQGHPLSAFFVMVL